jgi:hypothetical protein
MKKLLKFSSVLAMLVGVVMVAGGLWGIAFTCKNVTQERIITANDASIPGVPLRGPMTLKAQADIIRKHTLESTGGKTFAEMPRQIAKLDAQGNPVLDEKGQPVMVANTSRDIWITATTLMTALNLGILTYVFSGLIILFGLVSFWTGIIFWTMSKKEVFAE